MSIRARTMTMAMLSVRRNGQRIPCKRNIPLFGQRVSDVSQRAACALTQLDPYDVLMGAAR